MSHMPYKMNSELSITDRNTWRVIHHIDQEAVVILEGFQKQSSQTPQAVIDICKRRLREYEVD